MMKARLLKVLFTSILFLLIVGCASNQQTFSKAAIATSHPLATQAGFRALDQGGNAFDAAVAAAAVLSVVEPYGASLGGGSLWLLQSKEGIATLVDAREAAPNSASHITTSNPTLMSGPLVAAIPGQAAAFAHISNKYGIRPLAANLSDAVHIAEKGFRVNAQYHKYAISRANKLKLYPQSSPFLDNGEPPSSGHIIKQPVLAKTLTQLGRKGHKGFYEGPIADQLISDIADAGGIWSLQDLRDYKVIERSPITFEYENADITTPPSPSLGGITLQQILKTLEHFDISEMSRVEKVHLISQIIRETHIDNANTSIPLITSDSYSSRIANRVNLALASPVNATPVKPSTALSSTVNNDETYTPQITVLDRWGNRVSATLTINTPFGSGFSSKSTGVLLNNSITSFYTNTADGNTGQNKQNSIAPGRRPFTEMTPTLIETADSLALISASGGDKAIAITLLAIIDYIDDKALAEWVIKPRYNYSAETETLQHEAQAFSKEEEVNLEGKGLKLQTQSQRYGDTQIIYLNKVTGSINAISDPRGAGQGIVR